MRDSSPFGSRSRTRILLALGTLGSSYPRDLARRLESPIFAVRKALEGLQRDGLVTSRLVGRTRVYTLDPSYVAYEELAAYLSRLATAGKIQSRPQSLEAPPPSSDLLLRGTGHQPATAVSAASAAQARPSPDPDEGWRNW